MSGPGINTDFSVLLDLPLPVQIGVGVIVLLHVILAVIALRALARTPTERSPGHLPRLVWVLLIVLVQIAGSIAFLVLRRQQPVTDPLGAAPDAASPPGTSPATHPPTTAESGPQNPPSAVDLLYGKKPDDHS